MTLLFTTLTPDSLPSFTRDLLGTLDEIDEDRKKKAEEKEAGVGREQEKEDNKEEPLPKTDCGLFRRLVI